MAKIIQPTEENLRQMREFLCFGGLVSIPTETVYGLAANALDPKACLKIFEAKNRPSNDPLICHVAGFDVLDSFCEPNETARLLADAFWPGPLSLILPKKPNIPDEVTSGLGSVAVRSPKHPVFRQLVQGIDFPLAAPSANPFAYISPTCADHVQASLGDKIEYIIDGGPCEFGLESTIIDLRDESKPTILRHGALPKEEIEKAFGRAIEAVSITKDASTPAIAPGTLPKHYSPKSQLVLVPSGTLSNHEASESTAILHLTKQESERNPHCYALSENGQLSQIAANLFATLRELDAKGYDEILTEEAPELGLGQAINDRLRRAASK